MERICKELQLERAVSFFLHCHYASLILLLLLLSYRAEGCHMAVKSFYLKCFLLAKLQGVRKGPAFSCDNMLLCEMQTRKMDYLFARSLCSQILNAPADIFSMCIGKQELPVFRSGGRKLEKSRTQWRWGGMLTKSIKECSQVISPAQGMLW